MALPDAPPIALHGDRWLVTGAAGFIGSHLIEALLCWGESVVGLDDLSTGTRRNLDEVRLRVGPEAWGRFDFMEGDVADRDLAREACRDVRTVLHQAALGSVPRSLDDPWATHRANVDGFLRILIGAREAGCATLVYASSSSIYGEGGRLPKVEGRIGAPLSPYAASKRIDEIYAEAFTRAYGMTLVGLRYFNVFGPRQDPAGPYAAVIPRWIDTLRRGGEPVIYGDGQTTRDFCPVPNVVLANLLAARRGRRGRHRVYNVALGQQTSLLDLLGLLREAMVEYGLDCRHLEPRFEASRPGDVRHSLASTRRVCRELGYRPVVDMEEGLAATVDWFLARGSAR
ncbi:MAG: NAD-dependent epimerase/dehydratase family protein [Myxococcota bacterium]